MTTMTMHPSLLYLSNDILRHVVSFLDNRNALRLSRLNSALFTRLSLSILHHPEPLVGNATLSKGPGFYQLVPIPALLSDHTHSLVLTCQWQDQGWGERDCLFVVSFPDSAPRPSAFEVGSIVCKSPLAPHYKASLCMSFNYSSSNVYELWYRGSSAHQLFIENLTLHSVIHDSTKKWLCRNFDVLKHHKCIQQKSAFCWKLLRTTALSVRVQLESGSNADPYLVSMLEESGFPVTVESLKALEELVAVLAQEGSPV